MSQVSVSKGFIKKGKKYEKRLSYTNHIIGCRQNEEKAFCFMSADPVIEGSSIWKELMIMIKYRHGIGRRHS